MKLVRVCLLSLACVGGAVAFGVVANAAIELMIPGSSRTVAVAPKTAEPAQPVVYALASTTSTPAEITPTKVKTIQMLFRDEQEQQKVEQPTASISQRIGAVPLPRPRPASAPTMAMGPTDATSISRQPGAMAIAAATRKGAADDGEVLGTAGIERMRTALALTAEQEEFWPAIAAELQALGKTLKVHKGRDGKINVDNDTIQRLYWAAAPLITRLSYEQKQKVKQMAHVMGLHQVAQAL